MRSSQGTLVFEVLVHGLPVQEYRHEDEIWIEGRRGSEYTLRVRNSSNRRVAAVISVDGLSVMTGQLATSTDSAYILDPYVHVDVPGWRLDNDRVAQFYFGNLPESYAAQTGRPANIGVIGCAAFFERLVRPPHYSYDLESNHGGPVMRGGPMTYGSQTVGIPKGIGTGFGRETEHKVTSVQFQRESSPCARLVIRYDEATALESRGIRVDRPHAVNDYVAKADPFPGDSGCTPPPGWGRFQ